MKETIENTDLNARIVIQDGQWKVESIAAREESILFDDAVWRWVDGEHKKRLLQPKPELVSACCGAPEGSVEGICPKCREFAVFEPLEDN